MLNVNKNYNETANFGSFYLKKTHFALFKIIVNAKNNFTNCQKLLRDVANLKKPLNLAIVLSLIN